MRRSKRLIAPPVVVALSGAWRAGRCGIGNFDPTDMLDFLDTKKKLPGERKPVFPEGVPGLEQGVPKDLYKGARQQQIDEPNARWPRPPRPHRQRSPSRSAEPRASRRPRLPLPSPMPDRGRGQHRCRASAAQAGQKIVRHRTTAPPADTIGGGPAAIPATIRCAVPGADAERQLSRVEFRRLHWIDTPF